METNNCTLSYTSQRGWKLRGRTSVVVVGYEMYDVGVTPVLHVSVYSLRGPDVALVVKRKGGFLQRLGARSTPVTVVSDVFPVQGVP